MMHPIQCQCGTVRGHLEGTGLSNRLICYCTDCRAFARFLNRADVLDAQGGTEIVQIAQPRLRITKGLERIAAVRLSDKGMIRWYASCCKTPIGNTMASPKIAFIGLIHACLDREKINTDFGTTIAMASVDSALGDAKPAQRGMLRVIARFVYILLTTRVRGQYKNSQLFNATGLPIAEPTVLSLQQLALLKSAN
jgi:hypothetical protein